MMVGPGFCRPHERHHVCEASHTTAHTVLTALTGYRVPPAVLTPQKHNETHAETSAQNTPSPLAHQGMPPPPRTHNTRWPPPLKRWRAREPPRSVSHVQLHLLLGLCSSSLRPRVCRHARQHHALRSTAHRGAAHVVNQPDSSALRASLRDLRAPRRVQPLARRQFPGPFPTLHTLSPARSHCHAPLLNGPPVPQGAPPCWPPRPLSGRSSPPPPPARRACPAGAAPPGRAPGPAVRACMVAFLLAGRPFQQGTVWLWWIKAHWQHRGEDSVRLAVRLHNHKIKFKVKLGAHGQHRGEDSALAGSPTSTIIKSNRK